MKLEEGVIKKFAELIKSGSNLKHGNEHGQIKDNDHSYKCKGWLVSAQNLVHLVVTNPSNPYRKTTDNICSAEHGLIIHEAVGQVSVILNSLRNDIHSGLLASVENQIKALVFDNFLDHAKKYASQGMKNEAGVIAGVVFEDTLRSICREINIEESGVNLDFLITELTKREVLTQVKAKRARASADVRTKATHAQWSEFELVDVISTIEFTEQLIDAHLV